VEIDLQEGGFGEIPSVPRGHSAKLSQAFRSFKRGKHRVVVPLAVILFGAGIVLALFVVPWVGFVIGFVGLVLFIAFLAGFGRRAQSPTHDF
jgi:Flp pilus assembly protein TadB